MKKKPLVIRDTREQKPWDFPGYRIKDKELKIGDYTFNGYSKLIVVERKSLADYLSCLSKWAKWRDSQLLNLRKVKHRIIIVEGDPSIVRWGKYSSPQTAISGAIEAILDDVPVLFAGTRDMASFACIQFLEAAKKIVDSA